MQFQLNAETRVTLCTAFDHKFIIQGLTLIRSVERNTSLNISWNLLALTDECYQFLSDNSEENWNIFRIEDLKDPEFLELKSIRPWREFCWTSASVLFNFTLESSQSEFIGYIDADCFFFGDIGDLIQELYAHSLVIYPHNFSEDREIWLKKSGVFNVGVILGKNDVNAALCISEWRQNVVQECVNEPESGKCGDQTYLNEWPTSYSFIQISDRLGASLAPWNLNNFSIVDISKLLVDDEVMDFFHFHGLKLLLINRAFSLSLPAPGYKINTENYLDIYRFYSRELIRVCKNYKLRIFKLNSLAILKMVVNNLRSLRLDVYR